MKKLTLDVDSLRVDSFQASEPEAARGTVEAHGGSVEYSCQKTCWATCYDTCSTHICLC